MSPKAWLQDAASVASVALLQVPNSFGAQKPYGISAEPVRIELPNFTFHGTAPRSSRLDFEKFNSNLAIAVEFEASEYDIQLLVLVTTSIL
ncbi:hypothetical protein C8J56DRAFT_1053825 [Mycena floridula]|nr:hypothetical protein C8J56DRAFT_1053825 [Mycena floridula]